MTHIAYVEPIQVRPHPNPKVTQIAIGTVLGQTVIVPANTPNGALGVFFRDGTAISHDMCRVNNLFADRSLNNDQQKKGYLDKNGRVRVLKLQDIYSEGLWLPIECLSHIPHNLKAGDEIPETIGNYEVCTKWMPKETISIRAQNKKTQKEAGIERYRAPGFIKHYDTPVAGKVIAIASQFKLFNGLESLSGFQWSEKLHGTSARYYYGPVSFKTPLNWFQRSVNWFATKIGYTKPYSGWNTKKTTLIGTRNTTILPTQYPGFRQQAHRIVDAYITEYHKDFMSSDDQAITVYYEIVGYDGYSRIMPAFILEDNDELLKLTNESVIDFTYGCKPGEFKIFIYRITLTDKSGEIFELNPDDLNRLAKKHSQFLNEYPINYVTWHDVPTKDPEEIMRFLQAKTWGPSDYGGVIKEGVIVRPLTAIPVQNSKAGKLKGWHFCRLEGIKPYVDPEDLV